MKTISESKLKEILKLHEKWLKNSKDGVKADLSYFDLSGANFRGADLSGANFRGADLSGIDLSGADLRGANFRDVDLRGADLRDADFRGADLSGANFRGADLKSTKLQSACLFRAKRDDLFEVGNIGSRNDTTHYFSYDDRIICGCFDGTLSEFESKVKETYKENSKNYKEYMIAIRTFKELAELNK